MLTFEEVEVQVSFKESWGIISPYHPISRFTEHTYLTKEEVEALLRGEEEYISGHSEYTQREHLEAISLERLIDYLNKKYKDQEVNLMVTYEGSHYEASIADLYQAKIDGKIWFME